MIPIQARILPLTGKYYGTKIEALIGKDRTVIEVWFMGDYIPSEREMTEVSDIPKEELDDYFCDGHFETQQGYELAKLIQKALDGATISTKNDRGITE